jgi:3-oxoadipate enol-lactonase
MVMPKAKVKDVELYYEIHGEGYPLILIRGLGSNADHWYCQVPAFSERYSVVVFDNRGIGRSDKPDIPYTMSMMAEDTVGLMDALDLPVAHILGISMGGMIAQEIALRHQQRVNGLVLGCTNCGGKRAVPPSDEVLSVLISYVLTGDREAGREFATLLFTERTLRENHEIVERYQEISEKFPPSPQTMAHQAEAAQGFDSWEELVRIEVPTLVITGSEDILVPPENSSILAERIPGAQLRIVEGGGHQFLLEKADDFNRAVLEFLNSLPE